MDITKEIKVIYETPLGVPYHHTIDTAIGHKRFLPNHRVLFSHNKVKVGINAGDTREDVITRHHDAITEVYG